jgi:hypothetical protein
MSERRELWERSVKRLAEALNTEMKEEEVEAVMEIFRGKWEVNAEALAEAMRRIREK